MAITNPQKPDQTDNNNQSTPAPAAAPIPGASPGVKWIETEEDAKKAIADRTPTDPLMSEQNRKAAPTTPELAPRTASPDASKSGAGNTSESDRKR